MHFENCVIADFHLRHVKNACFATYPQLLVFFCLIAIFESRFLNLILSISFNSEQSQENGGTTSI